jgi:hypothetical protein
MAKRSREALARIEEERALKRLNTLIVGTKKRKDREPNCVGSQADRIFNKFGGPQRLGRILQALGIKRTPDTLYYWLYPKSRRGTGGLVPHRAWADIFKAARYDGIVITSEDLDPRYERLYQQKNKDRDSVNPRRLRSEDDPTDWEDSPK